MFLFTLLREVSRLPGYKVTRLGPICGMLKFHFRKCFTPAYYPMTLHEKINISFWREEGSSFGLLKFTVWKLEAFHYFAILIPNLQLYNREEKTTTKPCSVLGDVDKMLEFSRTSEVKIITSLKCIWMQRFLCIQETRRWHTSKFLCCTCISSNLRATFQHSRQLAHPNYCQRGPDASVSYSCKEKDYQQTSQP